MRIKEEAHKMKLVAPILAASSNEERNQALEAVARTLMDSKEEIL